MLWSRKTSSGANMLVRCFASFRIISRDYQNQVAVPEVASEIAKYIKVDTSLK